ncbi:MAG: N-6 DNA methylase [Sterolibacterium sp.]|nr:N-6 DNA methylase [Sterolibacterium sp.]
MLPKGRQEIQQYIRKLQPLSHGKAEEARHLANAVLHLWQQQAYPALVRRSPRSTKALLKNSLVVEFSAWLSGLDILTAAFWLSSAYAHWVGKDLQKEQALFFTPPALSARLIDNLIAHGASLTKHTWADPASGGAAFLAPVASRMAAALREKNLTSEEILRHIAGHLVGNDIDSCLARMSKEFLRMVLYKEITSAGFEPEFEVTTSNALASMRQHKGAVDVVICNPPYRKMPSEEVTKYRKKYQEVITRQPNLYTLFFKLALDLLKPGGTAGLLTPTSYLSGQYYSLLRGYLRAHAEVSQLDIIGALGAFVGVDQETAIAVFRRQMKRRQPTETLVFASTKDAEFSSIGKCRLPKTGVAWPVPRDSGDAAILRAVNGSVFRLADYGYVARVGAFVWNRDDRKTYAKLPKLEAGSVFPLVWSSDIGQEGDFQLGRQRPPGGLGKYVNIGRTNHASVIRKPCVALQRVTSTDQQRRLIGAAVPAELIREFGGVVGENHVVFLEQVGDTVRFTPTQLAQVLQSETIDRLFRCVCGAVNVSIFELDHLLLPDPVRLMEEMPRCQSIDEAVRKAFSL